MKKPLILAASSLALALTFSAPAFAEDDGGNCNVPSGSEWMSKSDVTAKTAEQGYNVRRVKREDGCYEVYATNKDGKRMELYINPVSGKIVKTKIKS